MHEWDQHRFHKMRVGIPYAELLFLYPVGFAGHIMHSSATGAGNIDVLFFMLGWDRYGFHKKHARTHCAKVVFLQPLGSTGHVVHSIAFGA
jgi:hypothetical protein